MMCPLPAIAGGAAAYLLGSIPFGFLIARSRGVDIRKLGSGNIGATNVFRSVSKPLGVLTFVLDMAKGTAGARLIPWLLARFFVHPDLNALPMHVFCGFVTVVGHNWTLFLNFKGGKGVATSAGLLLGLAPWGCGVALLVWTITLLAARYVSVASIAAAFALGIAAWPLYLKHGTWFPAILDTLALLAIWRHRSNMARLRAGTESRFRLHRTPNTEDRTLNTRS